MKYVDNIRDVAKLSPDFMGFIFYSKSKRYVGEEFVMPEINSEVKKVGVFVNEAIENILSKVKKHKLDYVQLHGNESSEYCTSLKNIKIIKAFGVNEDFDFDELKTYESVCEYFLFDTKSDFHGGSGLSFDKNILKKYNSVIPYFLSGGIDSVNIGEIKPFAIDVNSKFEIMPGFKDINKIKSLKDELSSQ